jgi:xanthine/uracil permease
MYAGAVAVRLIVGAALELPKEQVAVPINADLFCCGVVTIIQSLGIGPFGIRLPVMMGVAFASLSPMLAMAATPGVGITGVRSRWVCVAGGVILVAFGLFSRMAHVVASIPQFVLGGAGIVMFGMVAATGIRIPMAADLRANRRNPCIVAISLGFGMLPLVADRFFEHLPKVPSPLLRSGILLAAIVAVLPDLYFNRLRGDAAAGAKAAAREAVAH